MNEVQVLPTVLSYDGENQPDILSMIASSAALAISGLPFQGPIAASRVGYKEGKYLLNPSPKELEEFSIRFSSSRNKRRSFNGRVRNIRFNRKRNVRCCKIWSRKSFIPVIKAIENLAKKAGKPKWEIQTEDHKEIKKKIAKAFEKDLRKAFKEIDKKKDQQQFKKAEKKCKEMFAEDENISENQVMAQLKSIEKDIVRTAILKDKKRIDGRGRQMLDKLNVKWECYQEHMDPLYLPEEKLKL